MLTVESLLFHPVLRWHLTPRPAVHLDLHSTLPYVKKSTHLCSTMMFSDLSPIKFLFYTLFFFLGNFLEGRCSWHCSIRYAHRFKWDSACHTSTNPSTWWNPKSHHPWPRTADGCFTTISSCIHSEQYHFPTNDKHWQVRIFLIWNIIVKWLTAIFLFKIP